ncbi:MAG: phosphomethylpyrimidine synthase ThiC [Oscillospiraceae bacterium]|nr:phosphomethylpyrimidine synthase ThiC [Oscillospiraceae bacterium]
MDYSRKGILTPQMKHVLTEEAISEGELLTRIAAGEIALCANKNHTNLKPAAVGRGMRTKVNVNLGISSDSQGGGASPRPAEGKERSSACPEFENCADHDLEFEKARLSVELKADAIMDLSCSGKTQEFRRRLVREIPVMLGTVPMYDAIGFLDMPLAQIPSEKFIDVFETHAQDGVDFMTIHSGINRQTAQRFKRAENKRVTNIVSRGGSLLFCWMEMTGRENPFYEHYDRILEIAQKYDVTLSLGDACRPGCIDDATDAAQIEELITLGELTKRAWERSVQVMVEGPGHMALNEIVANMQIQKRLCHGAPFYVLGPLVTDVAPGYDHITSAIGGTLAAANGADFLCYVTPAEHLRLPDLSDMREGLIAARIAAHAADIAKGIPGARDWDRKMSEARAALDWNTMLELAIDPVKARAYRESSPPEDSHTCTMCGKMCAVRNMNTILKGEKVEI